MLNLNFQNGQAPALNARNMNAIVESINALGYAVGGPNVASTVSAMTDTSKVYVYTGSETGYTAGNWYYYNGSAWVSGGVYQAAAVETDTTLTMPGEPADAKATGDAVADLKSDLNGILSVGKNLIDPLTMANGKQIASDGGLFDKSNFNTCDFISIKEGKSITFSPGVRYIALYNESKALVENGYTALSSTQVYTVTATVTGYVRASFRAADSNYQAEYGTTATAYEPYTKKIDGSLGDVPMNQVNSAIEQKLSDGTIEETIHDYFESVEIPINKTSQLFDRNNVSVGLCENTQGYINVKNTGYVYTELIDVQDKDGRTIYFSINAEPANARFVTAYDANGEVLANVGMGSAGSSFLVSSGVNSIRITYHNPSSSGYSSYERFQAEFDEITPFTEYGSFFDSSEIANANNILYKKKWAVCGDSFTNGVLSTTLTDGIYKGKKIVYPYIIGNRNNMVIYKFFEGGRTIAYPASGTFANSLTAPNTDGYYQNIPTDVDYITIYLGINDDNNHHGYVGSGTPDSDGESTEGYIPLGTIEDTTTSSFYGAWNTVLTWLITNRPNAHIGIIVTNGSTETYRQAVISIAEKYGIAYIDMNGDQRTPAMIRTCNPNISNVVKDALKEKWRVSVDNTHPNDAAHNYESTFIENFLRSI